MRIDTARTTEPAHVEHQMPPMDQEGVGPDSLVQPGPEAFPDSMPLAKIPLEEHHHGQPFMLDSIGIKDRNECIALADSLRKTLSVMYEKIDDDSQHYQQVADRVAKLNDYAQKKYAALQQSIFVNPGSNYFTILSRFPMQWRRMKSDMQTKYQPLEDEQRPGKRQPFASEWRGPIVLFASVFILLYILIAAVLSNVIMRWLIPNRWRTENYRKKRPVYMMTLALFIFAIAVMVARQFISHNLLLMATSLMIEMAWMILAIFISISIRLDGDQCKDGAKIYTPFIVMSLIVICFRIILIPNTLVNVIFPPILLLFTIWQIITLRGCQHNIPTSDKIYCYISMIAMLVSCIMAWVGYTLMAVQVLVWWMFQLAAIATITCCYDLMEMYEDKYLLKRLEKNYGASTANKRELLFKMKRGDFIESTWLYDFINRALVPVCAVFSLLFSVYLATEIFDLRDLCFRWFFHPIVIPGVATFSFFQICLVLALYFVFKYLNYVIRASWFRFRRQMNSDFNATLAKNVIGLLIWGVYAIAVFLMLEVPSTGIAIVTGGLATGMGFASKSLLENFFYGISLMSGRVRVGDYIECDGITGKVESITYQSTQLITLDGSVVAILNSDLFGKNFKNLTRNHQYELIKIPFGVAYGSNVEEVRKMIIEGVTPLCVKTKDGRDIINPKNPLSVAFSDFGASSVDLFLVAWVLVDQRISFTAQAKEKIYNVLNEHGIEIPFPQQDVYVRSLPK